MKKLFTLLFFISLAISTLNANRADAGPSNLHLLFSNPEMIDLAWNDNSSHETGFVLEQSLSDDFLIRLKSFEITRNTSSYIIKDLIPDTTYFFRIKSMSYNESSDYSGVISVTTPPLDNFPLSLEDGRLFTSKGEPFLIIGDSPWSLIVGPDMEGAARYLENRSIKGVNSLIVNIVENYYNGPDNAYGDIPFLIPGDFSTPNPAYFDHVDYIIGKAREKGIEVFLYPAYLGYNDGHGHKEGWYTEVMANGPQTMYQYGKFIGQRYKDYKNIVWVMGGDCEPSGAIEEIRKMVLGIEEEAGPQLFSVQNGRFVSGTTRYSGEDWIDLNTTYADYATAASYCMADYKRNFPFYFVEGSYENTGLSPVSLRSQMYVPVLMGSNGSFFGNYPLFEFNLGWEDSSVLESQGSMDLQRSADLFKSRSWHKLVPDAGHTLLTGGVGYLNNGTYAAAALMNDSSSAIIYVPSYRQLTVNLEKISGSRIHAWWYQPASGYVTDFTVQMKSDRQKFVPPSSGDWILVLDDADLNLFKPGSALLVLKSKENPALDLTVTNFDEDFIYPNPALDILYFTPSSRESRVFIYDMEGRPVIVRQMENNSIDISALMRGIYIVKLLDNNKIKINRLVKK